MSSQDENQLPSSPPRSSERKQRKPPPITPRRFNRFFNPRPSSGSSHSSLRGSHALRSLEASDLNSRSTARSGELQHGDDGFPLARPAKRRRAVVEHAKHGEEDDVVPSSPPRSSPCPQLASAYPASPIHAQTLPTRIHRYRYYDRLEGPHHDDIPTATFRTRPEDGHRFTPHPYCTASCNTETLVAVGDQAGHVNLLDTAADADFTTPFLDIRSLHDNAITDLTFTSNDDRLATIGGDRLANIIDMKTQESIWTLHNGHTSTPKRIIFQPDNDSIVATCGRDGVISLWDLRTRAIPTVKMKPYSPEEQYTMSRLSSEPNSNKHRLLIPYRCLAPGPVETGARSRNISQRYANLATQGAASTRPMTLTSINFLPNGQSHLLLTSTSETDTLRIFDIRSTVRGTARPTPVSTIHTLTRDDLVPEEHLGTTTSREKSAHGSVWTALSPSGKHLYALTKGSLINVYSVPHLILGQPPSSDQRPETGRMSASPMLTLRHPGLNVGSFYVRCAASDAVGGGGRGDMLAVGSSRGAPIVFDIEAALRGRERQGRARRRGHEAIEEVQEGQALKGGHDEQCEVTGVCWTPGGELVSVSDDATASLWRERRHGALPGGGENGNESGDESEG